MPNHQGDEFKLLKQLLADHTKIWKNLLNQLNQKEKLLEAKKDDIGDYEKLLKNI